MHTRPIGSLDVSVVGLGCNNFGRKLDASGTARVVLAALDAGITFFDTADSYGDTQSEVFLGRALAGRRNEAVVATKFGSKLDERRHGASPAYIRRAVEDSLKRLNTDRIDLYQLHWPDPDVPIADTLGALDELVKAGKVREIGCSNFSPAQLRGAARAARPGATTFASLQNEYSLLHRDPEAEILPLCRELGVAFIPYFPLSSGLLTGKYRKGEPPPAGSRIAEGRHADLFNEQNLNIVERLIAFSDKRGHTILELAFSWLLRKPAVVSVIAGATRPEQVKANAAAADWKLSDAELAQIDQILTDR